MINTQNDTHKNAIDYYQLQEQLTNHLYYKYGSRLSDSISKNNNVEILLKYDIDRQDPILLFDNNNNDYDYCHIIKCYSMPSAMKEAYTADEITHQIIVQFVNELSLQELLIISCNELDEPTIKPYIFYAAINDINFCFDDYSLTDGGGHYGRNCLSDFIITNMGEFITYLLAHLRTYKKRLKDNPLQIDSILYLTYRMLHENETDSQRYVANVSVLINKLANLLGELPDYQSGMIFKVINYSRSTEIYTLPFSYIIRFTNWYHTTKDHRNKININFTLDNPNELGQLVDEIISNNIPIDTQLNQIRAAFTECHGVVADAGKYKYNNKFKPLVDSIGN